MTQDEIQVVHVQATRAYEQALECREAGERQGAIRAAQELVECWRMLDRAMPAQVQVRVGLVQALIIKGAVVRDGGLREEALTVAEEAVALLRALPETEVPAFLPNLALSLNNLAIALSGLGRREEAFVPAEEAVGIYRGLAQGQPQAFLPDLAGSLNNLSNRISESGRLEEALAPAEEAAEIYRTLAKAQPKVFRQDLAMSLNNLTARLSELGRHKEALAPAKEAVVLYRVLAKARPEAFLSCLSRSLNNLSNRLGELGRRKEALAPAEEAVGICRILTKALPQAFLPDLAVSLNNWACALMEIGRLEEAIVPAEEAIRIHRNLAQAQPQAFLSHLSRSLNNLSVLRSDLGRRKGALAPVEEAVRICRTLAKEEPQLFLPDLALSLRNLAARLRYLGRREEAVAPAEEGIEILRALAKAHPQTYLADLAMSLANLATLLGELGRREEAIAPAQDAVGIHRALAKTQPRAFRPLLALAVNNLAKSLSELGCRDEAVTSAEEAVGIWRSLAKAQPKAFRSDLAMSLNNLAIFLGELGRREEALAPAAEAVRIYRALAKVQQQAFLPPFAASLNTLASQLSELGRRDEALGLIEEAVGIRRALAKAHPQAFLQDLAASLYNLANRLYELGRREEALVNIGQAITLYQQLPPAIQRSNSLEMAKTHWNLACIHLSAAAPSLRDLPKACAALRDAVRCIEEHRGSFRNEAQRRRAISEAILLYELMIQTAIDLWEASRDPAALREALWAAEGVRQRQLLDRLRAEVVEPDAPKEVSQEWRQVFEQLEAAERALESLERDGTDSHRPRLQGGGPSPTADSPFSKAAAVPDTREALRARLTTRRDEIEARHKQVLKKVRRSDPGFDPYQPLPRAGLDDARRLLEARPGAVLVEYVVTESSGYALLVHGERVHPVRLPTVTTGEVQAIATKWLEGYRHGKLGSWGLGMRAKLAELAPRVLWPVLEELREFSAREEFQPEGLILCLHQYLNLLPFHAMPVNPGGVELLIDVFEVSYTPSLSMLKHAARRRPGSGKTCLIGDPKGDLRFIEAVTLAYRSAHPEAEVIHGEEGTVGAFLLRGDEMQRAEIWAHMGAAEDPMDAGIQFARGEVLRLHQIYRELRLRLRPHLVLNGCESGLMRPIRLQGTGRKGSHSGEVHLTDFDGLPMGLLFAGARSVVSTLWTVYDLSAALLMDRYHHEIEGKGATQAGALRRASQWLRKEIRNGEELRKVGEDLLSRVPEEWARQNADRIEHCRRVLAKRAREHPKDPPFAEPLHWASHYVTGWSWGTVVEGWDVGAGLKKRGGKRVARRLPGRAGAAGPSRAGNRGST